MLTLKALLETFDFGWARSYLPECPEHDPIIRSASVIGFPIKGYIREGDLVVCAIKDSLDNEEVIFQIIQGTHRAKAAAVLLSHEDDSLALNDASLEYIAKNRFPVFLVPWSLRYSDVFEYVFRETGKDRELEEFVWNLTRKAKADLREDSKHFGIDLEIPRTCIVGKAHERRNASTDKMPDINSLQERAITTAKQEAFKASREKHTDALLCSRGDTMVAYMANTGAPPNAVCSFIDEIERRVKPSHPSISFTWGISEISQEPADYQLYYRHAELAEKLCESANDDTRCVFYKDTFLLSALSVLNADKHLLDLAKHIIAPLEEYDMETGGSLIETLAVYAETTNVSKASRILNLHRQSLLYRLDKIERLTQMSLKDSDDLLTLQLAVKMTHRPT